MWLEARPELGDALRQGDLLLDVTFPNLKLPLPRYDLGQQGHTTTPTTIGAGVVVSNCCDNRADDYAAVAPVGRMRRALKDHQIAALLNPEPVWRDGAVHDFDVEHFKLDAFQDALPAPQNHYLVVNLNRTATFYGSCLDFRERRIARMTIDARRLLRIKLGVLWSRVEDEDLAALTAMGLPPGLTPPPRDAS